ncbi:hypothetical protein M413DRAFT_450019 [Hebeloma cylindrosporum]|uniref:Uncharacterized protein n=1 Tax=Hebeloma cylindrosporum TaxID=76867 RepID=A0A0C3BDI0_HEBCY|nr:hypothetical protein M413DRAFT_450019 [Hebeloma cylindrosporum h7]
MNMKSISPPTKPPLKRRRLLRGTTSSPTPTTAPKAITTNATGVKGVSICASCHRALSLTTGAGSIIQCAVCSSITCTVCSRTCTHSVTSQPPTPHLTWSPTPSPPLAPSPRRSVLALNSPNTNNSLRPADQLPLTPTQASVAGKRRKIMDVDGYDSDLPHLRHLKDLLAGDSGIDRQDQDQSELGLGCGRLVCRKCCYEDIPSNTTTCLECYGSGT